MAKLFLIPTTLATAVDHSVLTAVQLLQIRHIRHFITETVKIGRAHIKCLELITPLQQIHITQLNKHNKDCVGLIEPLLAGYDMGMLSDCGTVAVADPGATVVNIARQNNIEIVPLAGVCSLTTALASSGVNGQSFAFVGYMPIKQADRVSMVKKLAQLILRDNQSQIIIEAPFRNQQLFNDLISYLDKNIIVSLAINLMQVDQQIITHLVKDWREFYGQQITLNKQEVVFVIGKASNK